MSITLPKQYECKGLSDKTLTVWRFESLPTVQQAQKYQPLLVRMQRGVRELVEKKLVWGIIDAEFTQNNDYVHQRGSGIDPVLGKLCAQHNVVVLVDYAKIKGFEPHTQAALLGRVQQNARLAKKFGFRIISINE